MILSLVGIGLAVIGGGLFYRLMDDILVSYISPYIVDLSDPYYQGSQLVWDALPYIIIFVGIIILVIGALRSPDTGGVVNQ